MITSRDEQTAKGIHRLRTRLRCAAIVFARSRTTRCVRLTTDALATEPASCEKLLSKASLIPQPPQRDVAPEAAPSGASRPPTHDTAWTSRSTTGLWLPLQSLPKKALHKN